MIFLKEQISYYVTIYYYENKLKIVHIFLFLSYTVVMISL